MEASTSTVSPESLSAHRHLVGLRKSSSEQLGWSFPLVEIFEQPPVAEEFTTPTTPDLLVVMGLRGRLRIESRSNARWHSALYHADTIGLTAPGNSDTLRWRMLDSAPRRTLHVHVPYDLVEHTRTELGVATRMENLNVLDLESKPASALLNALAVARHHEAQPLVAQSIAQALTAELLATSAASSHAGDIGSSARLSRRALACVIEYMHSNLHRAINLDELAREVHLSKFHFLRAFSTTVGMTPHRYLTEVRMERAAELLSRGGQTVSTVASLCGYSSTRQFSQAFRRHHGITPGASRVERSRNFSG